MTETDLGHLPTSKMELALIIINGFPTCANSPVFARRLPHLSSITRHGYPVNSPALAIIFLSLLYLFSCKSSKIWIRSFIDSFSYLFVLLYLR